MAFNDLIAMKKSLKNHKRAMYLHYNQLKIYFILAR